MLGLGRVFNTLGYQISKSLNESIDQNSEYRTHKWNLVESNVVTWSKKPMTYLLLLLLGAFLYVILFLAWKPEIIALLPPSIFPMTRVVSWQGTLLSGQLTILGVIFPLVIGLVGVLLQRKSASKAIWYLYKRYSGFVFTGLSGILLAIIIVSMGSLELAAQNDTYQIVCILIAMWFVVNLFLTGWFLWATFRIVEEYSRDILLVKFGVNEAFFDDIRRSLSSHLPHRFIKSFSLEGDGFEVSSFRFSRAGDEAYTVNFSTPKSVSNISFRILYSAIFITKLCNKGSEGRLIIPVWGDKYSTSYDLVVSNGLVVPWYCKLLFRMSFSFSSVDLKKDVDIDSVVSAIVGSAEDALRDENERHFDESLTVLKYMVSQFINRLSFINDDGLEDNWLLLPEGSYSSFSYIDKLMRELYLLGGSASKKIHISTDFFSNLGYVPLGISNSSSRDLPLGISTKLLESNYSLWRTLVIWHSRMDQNDSYLKAQYEELIMDLVGRWESWPMYIDVRKNRWADGGSNNALYMHHLILSSEMIVAAIRHGSIDAARWGVDTLNRWFSNVTDHSEGNYQYYWNSEILVPMVLDYDKSSPEWMLIKNGLDDEVDLNAAAALATMTSWLDARVITACYLLKRPADDLIIDVRELVDTLISSSEIFSSGSSVATHQVALTGSNILSAFIRHRWYWRYGEGDYGSWINGLIARLNRIDEPARVSGRIYSGWGADDVRSLSKSYLELMLFRSSSVWSLSDDWKKILFSDLVGQAHRESLRSDLEGFVSVIDDDPLFKTGDWGGEDRLFLKKNCRSSICDVIDFLKREDRNEIVAADVDEERLKEIGCIASVDVFNADKRYFPISLFDEVTASYDEVVGPARVLNIKKYSKKNIVKVGANLAVNEDEWIRDCVKNHIVSQIFVGFLKSFESKQVEWVFDAEEDAKVQLKRDIDDLKLKGGSPVIFSGGSSFFNQVFQGMYLPSKKTDVERRDGYGDSYICHYYGVPAYRLPFSGERFVVLASSDMFSSLKLFMVHELSYVDVEYVPENSLEGDLSFKFWLDARFSTDTVWKYSVDSSRDEFTV